MLAQAGDNGNRAQRHLKLPRAAFARVTTHPANPGGGGLPCPGFYASHDQGQTWTGPTMIVAGNAPFSTIAGPLSYEGGALTSPGTNVAIDGSGTLHVLYIDSTNRVPMYTSSSDRAPRGAPRSM
jgi:hypothetical protein